jgi:ribosomal-protein-alanine N-acetyltransferase
VTPKTRIKDTARLAFRVGRTLFADQTSRHAAGQPRRCHGASHSGVFDGVDLISERLILHPVSADHVAMVMAGRRSPGWADDFPDEGDRVIAGLLTRRGVPSGRDQDFGQRLVIERASQLVVGGAGFFGPPDADGRTELGYGIVPSRQGRGYATEVLLELVRFGLADPETVELFAGVELVNVASVRVLEKAGLRRISETASEATYAVRR